MTKRIVNLPIAGDKTQYPAVDVLMDDTGRAFFVADCDVDCDGPNANPDGDPYWQPGTTLQHEGASIDSYAVAGIVLPPGVIKSVPGVVLGCKARITSTRTSKSANAVVYDIGPTRKLGEASVAAARAIGINSNPNTGGEDSYDAVLYEFWPGVPAIVDGVIYDLQPFNH
jgi:Fungal chitosanase of glycosyl hydrolase group 75